MLSLLKQKIQPLQIANVLREKEIQLFTSHEFKQLLKTSPRQTRYFIETYTKKGFLVRLKKDLYALKTNLPNEEIIANAIYKPSYISLEYALSHYGIIPESVYSITSVTTKATANFIVTGRDFLYRKIKRKAFVGYIPKKVGEKTILIAEPEKALTDYLYFVSLGRKTLNDRIDCTRLDKKKIIAYSKLYQRKTMDNIIEQIFKNYPVEIK